MGCVTNKSLQREIIGLDLVPGRNRLTTGRLDRDALNERYWPETRGKNTLVSEFGTVDRNISVFLLVILVKCIILLAHGTWTAHRK